MSESKQETHKEQQAESDEKKGWADMVDEDEEEKPTEEVKEKKQYPPKKKAPEPEPKKDYGPPEQRTKNKRGDYVVTKINIRDRTEEQKQVFIFPIYILNSDLYRKKLKRRKEVMMKETKMKKRKRRRKLKINKTKKKRNKNPMRNKKVQPLLNYN
jgi:hypothetical protein